MTPHPARKARALRGFARFLATLTVVAILASVPQVTSADQAVQALAAPAPQEAVTPFQARRRPLPSGAGKAPRVPVKSNVVPMDSTNPLFLPALTYGSGGGGAESMVIADLNGDGEPDLVVLNGTGESNGDGSVGVLLGNGDGTFRPALVYDSGGNYATSVAVADLNGDGRPDVVVTNYRGASNGDGLVGVLLGNGDGTFQAVQSYDAGWYGASSVTVADVNGDGKADVIFAIPGGASNDGGEAGVLLGNGDGTFRTARLFGSGGWSTGEVAVVVVDVNGDGKPDLVMENGCSLDPSGHDCGDGTVGVLLGNGDGTFQTAVAYDSGGQYPTTMTVADLNGDGKPDVLMTSFMAFLGENFWGVTVLLNNGDGAFNTAIYMTGSQPTGLAVADMNGDGKADIVTAGSTVNVLLGNGDGTFILHPGSTSSGGTSPAVADINGDGKPDVLVISCGTCLGVLLGNGDGTLQPVQTYYPNVLGEETVLVKVADLNGDGKPDLVVLNACGDAACDSTVGVLLNNTGRPYNPTTTALASSTNPAIEGEAVTYTASVTSQYGGTATGTMTFTDGTKTLVSLPLSGNQAAYTLSYKATGHRTIKAAYSGDADNGFSASAIVTEDVVVALPIGSKALLATSGSPSIVGQPVTFTASVSWAFGTVPNGELVTFYDGVTPIGTGTTASGVAVLTTSSLSAKTHSIKATYAGDASFKSTSGTLKQEVGKNATTTALVSSPNPSVYGQAVTFTATVASSGASVPTGRVTFTDGTTTIGSAAVSGGVAAFKEPKLAVGSHSITATYDGDAVSAKSTATVLIQVVN
jgi:hypothetical protein